jgi:hypothetical protein
MIYKIGLSKDLRIRLKLSKIITNLIDITEENNQIYNSTEFRIYI